MTGFNSNLDELIKKFKVIAENAKQVDIVTALEAGVNEAKGRMQNRIFNQGEAADGTKLGVYVGKKKRLKMKILEKPQNQNFLAGKQDKFSQYEKKRVSQGRQIRYKDFEFTGTLRRGIVVIREIGLKVVCAIPSPQLQLIAAGLEKQTAKILGVGELKVFTASEDELKALTETTTIALTQLYDRILNS